jgi:hypothetical protein
MYRNYCARHKLRFVPGISRWSNKRRVHLSKGMTRRKTTQGYRY